MIRAAFLALALLPLTACGFSPVYGGVQANAGPITINEIRATATAGSASGRTGHFLRQELVRSVGQGVPGFSAGTLDVALRHAIERLAFAADPAPPRPDHVGLAPLTLPGTGGALPGTRPVEERASLHSAHDAHSEHPTPTAC